MILGDVIETSRHRRSVLIHPQFYWPGGIIHYEFDTIYPLSKYIYTVQWKLLIQTFIIKVIAVTSLVDRKKKQFHWSKLT